MADCFFIHTRRPLGGGGNALYGERTRAASAQPGSRRFIVRRSAAIGDSVCASIVADRLISLGHSVIWQTHGSIHGVMRRHLLLSGVAMPAGRCDVDLDGAYEKDPARATRHFHEMFFAVAQRQLDRHGVKLGPPTNCRPKLVVPEADREAMRASLADHPRPWIVVCPRSNNFACRTVADGVWQDAAAGMPGTKLWIGTHGSVPAGVVDCKPGTIERVMDLLACADLLVTVDTGPLHLAAALGTPVLAIEQAHSPRLHLTDQNDWQMVSPALDCLNCQQHVCPISQWNPPCQHPDPAMIAAAATARLSGAGKVSVVMPTHAAPAARLRRCIDSVLPQVHEVVIPWGADSKLPPDAPKGAGIRYVRSPVARLGYGRKANFGVRHAAGEFILLMNDDCYLAPGAVEHLLAEMRDPSVGMVGHFLRYPDGRICHGGKYRSPGMRGWGLIDNRKYHPTIKAPTQMENVTGTSVLVRRSAFYDAGAFDADFYLYCEDDAFSLQMGRRGWKIMYTPHAEGVHDEAATSRLDGKILDHVREGQALFERKWGWWVERNLHTVPGTF